MPSWASPQHDQGRAGGNSFLPVSKPDGGQKIVLAPKPLRHAPPPVPRSLSKLADSLIFDRKQKENEEIGNSSSDRPASTETVIRYGTSNSSDAEDRSEEDQQLCMKRFLALKLQESNGNGVPSVKDGPCRTVNEIFRASAALECYANVEDSEQSEAADDTSQHLSRDNSLPGSPIPRYSDLGSDIDWAIPGERNWGPGDETTRSVSPPPPSPYPSQRGSWIPDCTAAAKPEIWRVTDSGLKALAAMRGPQKNDATFVHWMERNSQFRKPTHYDAYLGSCDSNSSGFTGLETPSSDDSSAHSPIEGQAIEVPRPHYEHIRPPPGFDAVEHSVPDIEVPEGYVKMLKSNFNKKSCWSIETDNEITSPDNSLMDGLNDDFYISDDEGDPQDGRISPCTFRLWAEGCERWETNKLKNKPIRFYQGTEQVLEAARPPSGSGSDTSWVPLGFGQEDRLREWQQNLDNHVGAPAKWCQTHADYAAVRHDPETFGDAEVRSALQADDAPELYGFPARQAEGALDVLYKAFNDQTILEQHLRLTRLAAEAQLSAHQAQLDRVCGSVANILHKRKTDKDHRRNEIYRHLAQHIKDMDDKCKEKTESGFALSAQIGDMMARDKELQERVRMEARKVGVTEEDDLGEIERIVRGLDRDEVVDEDEMSFF